MIISPLRRSSDINDMMLKKRIVQKCFRGESPVLAGGINRPWRLEITHSFAQPLKHKANEDSAYTVKYEVPAFASEINFLSARKQVQFV